MVAFTGVDRPSVNVSSSSSRVSPFTAIATVADVDPIAIVRLPFAVT